MTQRIALIVLVILCFVVVTIPQIVFVRAQDAVYIHSDGTVEGTDKIQRDGDLYTFTGDIYCPIIVEKDFVVVDGAGYTLNGSGFYYREGIDLSERNNVTIKNMQICGFEYGIYLQISSMNSIYGNNITANGFAGINMAALTIDSVVVGCSLNSIYDNNITGNSGEGISFHTSSENIIHDNNISSNGYDGLFLDRGSSKNAIVANNIKNNDRDGIMCVIVSGSNIISGNNISDNKHNGVTLTLNSDVNIVSENNIHNNLHGIDINNSLYPSKNTISGNNITNNDVGIVISQSSGSRIYHNNFDNNDIDFLAELGVNSLDNGSEGNYWNNYTGSDSNGDGIGDMPYVIDAENQDNYPLMRPIEIPEFSSWATLPIILILTLFWLVLKRSFKFLMF